MLFMRQGFFPVSYLCDSLLFDTRLQSKNAMFYSMVSMNRVDHTLVIAGSSLKLLILF